MIEGKVYTFNMFDGDFQYQGLSLTALPMYRMYISSHGFASHYTVAII